MTEQEQPGVSKLKVLDLFAGIGGFSLGLEKTGLYETAAFCEWDDKARMVLKKHWPDTQIFSDVRNISGYIGWVYETYHKSDTQGLYDLRVARPVDVITGGFPCQDISNSGSKAGLAGERSGLWFEYLRLISEIKPKGVIIENVSALRTRGLETVLIGLNEVGYDAEWHCIPASATGAPHERDRLFIVAYPSCVGQQGSWEPIESIYPTKDDYREASDLVNAFQRKSMPFVCGRHDGFPKGVDRLKQLGNAVCPSIVSQLGVHLYKNLEKTNGIGQAWRKVS